ncbi:MAG: sensor histidine kinase [Rhodospirillaceae bacterium]
MTALSRPGWNPEKSRTLVVVTMTALAAVLFAIDIHFPPGVLDGIGYPSLMIFTLWIPGRRVVIVAAAVFSLLTVIAYTLLQPGGIGEANIANRAFALMLVWLVAGLIDHRKVSDTRLQEALRRAETASAAKSKFLATLSHELRTPLNAILGFSESLMGELFGPLGAPRNKECARHINSCASHLLGLISDLLDFANLEQEAYTADIRTFDIGPHLQKVMKAAEPAAANAQITLHWAVPERLPSVRGDVRLVEQTVRNLLDNALMFTRPGGWVELHGGTDDEIVWIEVRDNGVGMPEEIMRLIGEPFVRAADPVSSSPGGTGLGLAIAKVFTEQQRGTFLVKSQLSTGTTVRVAYPRMGGGGYA